MSEKEKIVIGVVVAVFLVVEAFWGYKYFLSQGKPCPQPVVQKEEVKKPTAVKKKSSKKVVAQVAPTPPVPALAPVPAPTLALAPVSAPLALVPALAPAPQKLTLRLNVVEWNQIFEGRSLMPQDIGPLIRKGLSDGTITRTTTPLTFDVNGAAVAVQNGQAVLDPGKIGPETAISVRPLGAEKFVLPPGAQFPLVVGSEEMEFLAKKGVKEIWLNFLLAPR